jgi:hypothetical protein
LENVGVLKLGNAKSYCTERERDLPKWVMSWSVMKVDWYVFEIQHIYNQKIENLI